MNNAALDAAIDWAAAHPEQHEQGSWRSRAGMCIAGILCHLDPDTEFYSSADDMSIVRYGVFGREATADGVFGREATAAVLVRVGDELMTIAERAAQILEQPELLYSAWPGYVFYALNTLDDVRAIAARNKEMVNA